jgi:ribose transport system substrate-binding protein
MHDRVVVIPRLATDAPWLSEHVGIAEGAERAKLEFYSNGPSEEPSVQTQIELADRAIREGAYGIVAEPTSLFAMNRVIQKALAKRIPVVILSEPIGLPTARHLSFVLNDVKETGRLTATRLQTILHGRGEVAIVGLDPQAPGNIERSDSIDASLRQIAPEIHIVEKVVGSFSIGYSEQAAERAIREHPDLKAIVALNEREGYSAAAAVRASGAEGRVLVISCDQSLRVLLILRQGGIDSLVIRDMRGMGAAAVSNIAADRLGKDVVSPIFLKPLLVTRENIGDENIQQLLMMHRARR